MRHVATALFLGVGLINLAPAVGVIGSESLQTLYGLSVPQGDLALLMRHRAVLLGLVGAILVVAAFRSSHRRMATLAGLVSMVSFVLLAVLEPPTTPQIERVLLVDYMAILMLIAAAAISRHSPSA
jgi:hypothetical protein